MKHNIKINQLKRKLNKTHTLVGNLKIIPLQFDDKGNKRNIRIWTPEGLKCNEETSLLIMFDGQNLFDDFSSFAGEWQIDETISNSKYNNVIVVGLDNHGTKRLQEYCPSWENKFGLIKQTEDFIFRQVIPYVKSNYIVSNDSRKWGLFGSSMGGIATFDIGLRHLDTFGFLGCFSSAFCYVNAGKRKRYENMFDLNNKTNIFYIDSGTGEELSPEVKQVADELVERGLSKKDIIIKIDNKAKHNEAFWAKRFINVYNYFNGEQYKSYESINRSRPIVKKRCKKFLRNKQYVNRETV